MDGLRARDNGPQSIFAAFRLDRRRAWDRPWTARAGSSSSVGMSDAEGQPTARRLDARGVNDLGGCTRLSATPTRPLLSAASERVFSLHWYDRSSSTASVSVVTTHAPALPASGEAVATGIPARAESCSSLIRGVAPGESRASTQAAESRLTPGAAHLSASGEGGSVKSDAVAERRRSDLHARPH